MSDVEAIKNKIDIVQLVGESVTLKKAGRSYKGLCPFHNEKSPSFNVDPERQAFHCFGCNEGGDIFEFVMKQDRVDFPEALRMLATRAGIQLKGFDQKAHRGKQRLFEVTELAAQYFVAALNHGSGRKAKDYLKSRGISDKTAKEFQIGYAPDDFDAMVTALKKKKVTDKELIDAGLAIAGKRGSYARFRGRLMIPIADTSGAIRGFTGRVLDPEAKEAKYVNTPETTLYHKGQLVFALHLAKQAIIDADQAVLVEGQMDVITAHQAGTANVVATSGTALTEDQLRQLTRFSKIIALALDNDAAGQKAMARVAELVGSRDVELKVVDLGEAKDPDELIQKNTKTWQKALEEAEPIIDFLLRQALAGQERPYSRAAITAVIDAVLPVLRFRPTLDQDYYLEQLATTLGLEKATLKTRLAGLSGKDISATTEEAAPIISEKTPEDLVSERLIGLALTTPELAPKLAAIDARIFSTRYAKAAETAKTRYTGKTDTAQDLSRDEQLLLDVCALAAAEYEPMTQPERAAEFDRLYARLKLLWVKQHQPKLLAAIKRAEESGDRDRRNRLMEEYTTLTKRIAHNG